MTEATTRPGPCQVKSKTESPCLHPAAVEIRGIPFCEPCAREQEAYFAIGELTQGTRELRSKPLAEALGRMRRELRGGSVAARRPEHPGIDDETRRLELTISQERKGRGGGSGDTTPVLLPEARSA